jgi:hypothetical protein
MAPKVRNAKNTKRAKMTWRQAIVKAWKSKGERGRELVSATGNTNGSGKSLNQWIRNRISSHSFLKRGRRSSTGAKPSHASTVSQIKDDDAVRLAKSSTNILDKKSSCLLSNDERPCQKEVLSAIMDGAGDDGCVDVEDRNEEMEPLGV